MSFLLKQKPLTKTSLSTDGRQFAHGCVGGGCYDTASDSDNPKVSRLASICTAFSFVTWIKVRKVKNCKFFQRCETCWWMFEAILRPFRNLPLHHGLSWERFVLIGNNQNAGSKKVLKLRCRLSEITDQTPTLEFSTMDLFGTSMVYSLFGAATEPDQRQLLPLMDPKRKMTSWTGRERTTWEISVQIVYEKFHK